MITPGPWQMLPTGDVFARSATTGRYPILIAARPMSEPLVSPEAADANAKAIAAVPDLLEAMLKFVAWNKARPDGGPLIVGLASRTNEIRAALEKAGVVIP